ncbi:sensor histidine kinase [Pedobacter sp. HMF7647]|uniref:histidine kinase n=1 Tax=Hufsiella arboris TaxID=2695275 RepID=A0A7K1Y479_9SPHI|nr:HAMP domain-containing sensor histidine kinase [Hufsiella arboris]MXV49382.1 sensor histidine kinase [Hufsiella arboris]
MKADQQVYRKNFVLVVAFLVLISLSLIAALLLGFNLTKKYVENEFYSAKINVQEEIVKPYEDFFQNKIPEISFYQGYLDSVSVVKYVDTVLKRFDFVTKVVFYDTEISNHQISDGLKMGNMAVSPRSVLQFKRNIKPDSVVLYKSSLPNTLSIKNSDEFNKMAIRFASFIEAVDTAKALSNDDIFYNISPSKITYMNIPRREELKIFKDLMKKSVPVSPLYQEDILTFYLEPQLLKIKNTHPELYQKISIKPLVYESIDTNPNLIATDIALPGALADYKLYFSSYRDYLNKEIARRFLPIAIALILIYGVLVTVAYLIFRNLNINSKMFKLQYDFINNLTHEFKTPVSVIKIAGNNIRSSHELTNVERKHYGKILDEEADKLNDLMNKLLSFTQIENRSIKLKYEEISLEVFIQNVIDTYQLKHPDFDIDCAIDDVGYFKSDPVLLASVFSNLIDNAYKYSPADRKQLDIRVRKAKRNIEFVFTDSGIGIPASEINNIFRKFYRVQSQYNQQGSVGLGLAFCKELLNFMNGDIFVTSVVNKGSVFTVTLPFEV